MNGKILCLREGREHKDLKLAQLTFGEDSGGEFVVYTEGIEVDRTKILVTTKSSSNMLYLNKVRNAMCTS